MTTFRTPKSERTFETVLEAATRLFAGKGYYATTIRDIAKESGLALGALYYHFQSKEELVLRFYERMNKETIAAFRDLPNVPNNLPEMLARFLRLKIAHLAPYRGMLRVVMKEAVDPESPLCPLHPASSDSLNASVGLFREMVIRGGAASGTEVEEMARALWLAHMGVLAFWLHDKSEGNRATDRAIDTLAGLVRFSTTVRRIPGFGALRRSIYGLVSSLFPTSEDGGQETGDEKPKTRADVLNTAIGKSAAQHRMPKE